MSRECSRDFAARSARIRRNMTATSSKERVCACSGAQKFTAAQARAARAGSNRRSPTRGRRARIPSGAQLLCLQAALREDASLLRLDVRRMRRIQLRQARTDGRPRRPLRTHYRRARQDRFSGIFEAAARRRACDRHHPLPSRRHRPVFEGARLRRHFKERLEIHGLDLRHTPSVELFAQSLLERLPRLDYLLNNACQTVRRPAGFFAAPAGARSDAARRARRRVARAAREPR